MQKLLDKIQIYELHTAKKSQKKPKKAKESQKKPKKANATVFLVFGFGFFWLFLALHTPQFYVTNQIWEAS